MEQNISNVQNTSAEDNLNITALKNVSCDLSGILKAQHHKMWMRIAMCKYNRIEIENIQKSIDDLQKEITQFKTFIEHEKNINTFLKQQIDGKFEKLEAAANLYDVMDELIYNIKDLIGFNYKKHNLKIKELEEKYLKEKSDYEVAFPLYSELKIMKGKHLKLYVLNNIACNDKLRTIEIIKTRNNLNDKLFYSSITLFIKTVMSYKDNELFSGNIVNLHKKRFELSHVYQQKRLEKEKLQRSIPMQKIGANDTMFSGWGKMPEITNITTNSNIKEPVNSKVNVKSQYSSTMQLLQKMKMKAEEAKQSFEKSKRAALEDKKKMLSNSINKSLEISFEKSFDKDTSSKKLFLQPSKPISRHPSQMTNKNKSLNLTANAPNKTSKAVKILDHKIIHVNQAEKTNNVPTFINKEVHFQDNVDDERVFKKPRLMKHDSKNLTFGSTNNEFMDSAFLTNENQETTEDEPFALSDDENEEFNFFSEYEPSPQTLGFKFS